MNKIVLLSILCILILGCDHSPNTLPVSDSGETYYFDEEADAETRIVASQSMAAAPLADPVTAPPPPPGTGFLEKKIIRNGNLSIKSTNLKKSRTRLDTLVSFYAGYVSAESFNDQEDQLSYNITCRIPAEKFDLFITGVEDGPDKIISKSVNANDVTEQYYDITIRLENEKQVEKRYLELLDQARSVKDILEIEEKLGKVRQEIESKEGRPRYLNDRVGYSTLNIWIYQEKDRKYEPADRDKFGQRLKKALHSGWQGFGDFILFFLNLWPLWIIGLLIWRLVVYLNRRSKKRKKQGEGK